ncbi:MAG: hypothetical protein AB1602_01755 [Elusimicrobiota bacterium]
MSEEKFELFKKGCLGTCWYGKYHYMEPWVGCSHNCPYCYARFRKSVKDKLKENGNEFEKPKLFMPQKEFLDEIKKKAYSGEIKILKLSRFTDFFVPEFVKNGLSEEILNIFVKSPIERIIITTKGIGNDKLAEIIGKNKDKFSYNAAVRPLNELDFKENVFSAKERIEYASKINSLGVLTTLHLDPFVADFDDGEEFSEMMVFAKKTGLKRAMFSYLLVSDEILEFLKDILKPEVFDRFSRIYDLSSKRQYLPNQTDTVYYSIKEEIKKKSIESAGKILNSLEFEFVLCSLKSVKGLNPDIIKEINICDGKFYA